MAGRLFSRFASTALSAAIASRSGSDPPAGRTAVTAERRPLSLATATITPSPSTNTRNPGSAARSTVSGVAAERSSAGSVSAVAPAAANHTGAIPSGELSAKPASVSPSTASANRGAGRLLDGALPTGRRAAGRPSSTAKNRRSTTHSTAIAASQGSAISAAKRVNDRPLALNASRFVRLETASSSEAELARWVHA